MTDYAYAHKVTAAHTKRIPWIKPNQCRKYDGLNPVYGIMTVIKHGAGQGECKYMDTLWAELCLRIGPWPSIMWDGMTTEAVREALLWAVNWYNTTKYRVGRTPDLLLEQLTDEVADKSPRELLIYLRSIQNEDCFFFARTEMMWDHWVPIASISVTSNVPHFTGIDGYSVCHGAVSSKVLETDIDKINVQSINPKRLIDVNNLFRITRIHNRCK